MFDWLLWTPGRIDTLEEFALGLAVWLTGANLLERFGVLDLTDGGGRALAWQMTLDAIRERPRDAVEGDWLTPTQAGIALTPSQGVSQAPQCSIRLQPHPMRPYVVLAG